VARQAGGQVVAALAARFRSFNVAEDAFAEACARAAEVWPREGAAYNAALALNPAPAERLWLQRHIDRSGSATRLEAASAKD
jgi:predicted RNA polymerase sigma factor